MLPCARAAVLFSNSGPHNVVGLSTSNMAPRRPTRNRGDCQSWRPARPGLWGLPAEWTVCPGDQRITELDSSRVCQLRALFRWDCPSCLFQPTVHRSPATAAGRCGAGRSPRSCPLPLPCNQARESLVKCYRMIKRVGDNELTSEAPVDLVGNSIVYSQASRSSFLP